ncbi:hypothetical protein [Streptomyces sp. ICBB 8177]|uniref:hypothetical protein n=1 Tax=Streptomyces sp. ICBB 8177 TaxID=563922 RepID=UPI000D68E44B|nr:hypothetical protein [Streptomyces sp. ICBB 8177]
MSDTNDGGTGLRFPAPGSMKNLASSPAAKKAAVTALHGLATDLKTDGSSADSATHEAVAGLKGWETAAGLSDALTEWHRQVATLNGRFTAAQRALSGTNTLFGDNDGATASSFGTGPLLNPATEYPVPPYSKLSQF